MAALALLGAREVRGQGPPGTTTATVHLDSLERPAWRPIPNPDESLPGNSHHFSVYWTRAQGDPLPAIPRYLRVIIRECSSYPGVAGNWGSNGDFDLKIEAKPNPDWRVANSQSAETTIAVAPDTLVLLEVGAFDGAAEMTIYAKMLDRDSKAVLGVTQDQSFPFDKDEDGLPEAWEDAHKSAGLKPDNPMSRPDLGVTDDALDTDGRPEVDVSSARHGEPPGSRTGLGVTGDGLTAWEEYRGFIVFGQWKETSPEMKDLFYFPEHARAREWVPPLFDSKIKLKLEEVDSLKEMVVNRNNIGRHGATRQRGLRIRRGDGKADDAPDGALGEARLRYGSDANYKGRMFIHTGANGRCETFVPKDENEVQLIPFDAASPKGMPDVPFIAAGGRELQTRETPDDEVVANVFITTGADGIAQTTKAPNDLYIEFPEATDGFIGLKRGAPNQICIDAGDNGEINLEKIRPNNGNQNGDDAVSSTGTGIEAHISLTPNETLEIVIYDDRIEDLKFEPPSRPEFVQAMVDAVIGHEMGHGVHMPHYDANERERPHASYMVSARSIQLQVKGGRDQVDYILPSKWIPKRYDEIDLAHRRLHLKHR